MTGRVVEMVPTIAERKAQLAQEQKAKSTATMPAPVTMPSIADAIRIAIAAGDERYRDAGRLFQQQKDALDRGQWLPWLKSEGFNERTARRHMAYAKTDSTVRYADWLYEQTWPESGYPESELDPDPEYQAQRDALVEGGGLIAAEAGAAPVPTDTITKPRSTKPAAPAKAKAEPGGAELLAPELVAELRETGKALAEAYRKADDLRIEAHRAGEALKKEPARAFEAAIKKVRRSAKPGQILAMKKAIRRVVYDETIGGQWYMLPGEHIRAFKP